MTDQRYQYICEREHEHVARESGKSLGKEMLLHLKIQHIRPVIQSYLSGQDVFTKIQRVQFARLDKRIVCPRQNRFNSVRQTMCLFSSLCNGTNVCRFIFVTGSRYGASYKDKTAQAPVQEI